MSEKTPDAIGEIRDLSAILPTLLTTLDLTTPGLGSALSAGYSEFTTRRRMKHIEDAISKIAQRLKPEFIFNTFKDDPAAMQLIHHIFRRLEVEQSEQKRERYANLIVASWITSEPVEGIFDEAILFAEANASFTDAHLAFLRHLYDCGEGASVSFDELAQLVCVAGKRERSEIAIMVLTDLCSKFVFVHRARGLNDPSFKPGLVISTRLSPEGIARMCNHAITARGQRYNDYVIRGPHALNTASESGESKVELAS